jgi:transcriptional regulator GlxA family with amidase domain
MTTAKPISSEAFALIQWMRERVLESLFAAETAEQLERATEELRLVDDALQFAARQQMAAAGLL